MIIYVGESNRSVGFLGWCEMDLNPAPPLFVGIYLNHPSRVFWVVQDFTHPRYAGTHERRLYRSFESVV